MSRVPAYQLSVDGTDITAGIQGRLIDLTLTESRGESSDSLSFTIDDHDGRINIPRKGAEVSLKLGWKDGALIDKGKYIVDTAKHSGTPDKISVTAHAADMRETLKEKQRKGYHDKSLGDILKEVSGRHGLTPAISDKLAKIKIPHLDQLNESDLHFLNRLGRHYDAVAAIKAGKLVFKPRADGKTVSGQPLPGIVITRAMGDQHSYSESDRESNHGGCRARWRDKDKAKEREEVAGEKLNPFQLRRIYPNQQEAKQAAESEWKRRQRGKASFSVTLAIGRPELAVELPTTLVGWKLQICSWDWVIDKLTHRLGGNGLTTTVGLEVKAG